MCSVTHTCQRAPQHVRNEAFAIIPDIAKGKVVGENRSLKYIINRDQTPVFFDMSSGRTPNQSGKKFLCACSCLFPNYNY